MGEQKREKAYKLTYPAGASAVKEVVALEQKLGFSAMVPDVARTVVVVHTEGGGLTDQQSRFLENAPKHAIKVEEVPVD